MRIRDLGERVTRANPCHPGEIIRDYLDSDDCELTAVELARKLRVTRSTLYRVLRSAHSSTAVLALRLERMGWSTAQAWLRMQAAYDLAEAKHSKAV